MVARATHCVMRLLTLIMVGCGFLGTGIPQLHAAENPARIMVVFDGSGSMWGQVDGRAKIEIAKEAMAEFLESADPSVEIGLMAYGHRRKGDCDDIEELSAPTLDRAALLEAVNAITPRGKTPLSQAVRMAAEALRFEEEAAAVMLITDGLETCGGDPCDLGKELERLGLDFVCHVVGFDVEGLETGDLECLAKETGGVFVTASDVDQLTDALQSVAQEIAEPASVTVRAVEGENGPALSPVTFRWKRQGSEEVLEETIGRETRVNLEPGTYEVAGTYEETTARLTLEVGEGESMARELVFDLPRLEASLEAPEQVAIGENFQVAWEGPGDRYDDVLLAKPGEKAMRRERIRGEGPVTMAAPAEPGEYELRYWNGTRGRVLATRPIVVGDRDLVIVAEEVVPTGGPFEVGFENRPNGQYDDIQITRPEEEKVLRSQRIRGETVTIVAMSEPGEYELRYWNGENRAVLARKPIRFEEVGVQWEAPERVRMAESFSVEFENRPAGRYDDVQIYDQASDKVVRSQRIRSDKVSLAAPAKPGIYELRYWVGQDKAVLATRPIEVEAVELDWQVPESVPIGSPLVVTLEEHPRGQYDDVQIVNPADGKVVRSSRIREQSKVTLESPGEPGQYEVRYWIGQDKLVFATEPLEVTDVEVKWQFPQTVDQGKDFQVTLEARPEGRYDDLQIVDPTSGKVIRSQRIRSEQVMMKAPDEPGTYQLRYWMGGSKKVQSEADLEVQ